MLEEHRPALPDRIAQRVGTEHELVGGTHHATALEGHRVVLEQLVGVAQQPGVTAVGVVDDHPRVLGQEVEDRLLGGLQQRSERLDARRQVAPQQRVDELVDAALGQALLPGPLANRVAARDHQLAVAQQLAGRRRRHVRKRGFGALARRVELAQLLHLVAQQLDADRSLAVGREEVEDVPADGQLAPLLDEWHALVAGSDQQLDQRVPVDGLPHLEMDRLRAHGVSRRHPQRERRPGRDHDRRRLDPAVPRGQQPAVEHVHALGDHERLRREALVGLDVVAREDPHAPPALGLAQVHAQVGREEVGRLRVGGEHEDRARLARGRDPRSELGARGPAQAADARTAVALQGSGDHAVERSRECALSSACCHQRSLPRVADAERTTAPSPARGGGGARSFTPKGIGAPAPPVEPRRAQSPTGARSSPSNAGR